MSRNRLARISLAAMVGLASGCIGPWQSEPTFQPAVVGTETVLVIGDWGSGSAAMVDVAEVMRVYAEGRDIEAILTTGDNFYIDDDGALLRQYRWALSAGIEFWITWGNHDVESPARVDAVNRAFGSPPRWDAFGWHAVNVVILDSTRVGSPEQNEFFESEMETSDRPAIVTVHHPPYSCTGRRDGQQVLTDWVPELDDNVVLVLAGHDHNYQRFEVGDLAYVVTGGGGARLNPIRDCPPGQPGPVATAETHHFLAIHQTDDALSVEAIDINGSVIDGFTIDLADR